jgi:hypothetical protein
LVNSLKGLLKIPFLCFVSLDNKIFVCSHQETKIAQSDSVIHHFNHPKIQIPHRDLANSMAKRVPAVGKSWCSS